MIEKRMGDYRFEMTHITDDEMVDKTFSVRVNDETTWTDMLEAFCDGLFAMGFCAGKEDVKEEAQDYEGERAVALSSDRVE